MGETVTYITGKRDVGTLSHTACLSTLSFSIARSLGFQLPKAQVAEAEKRWSRSRTIVGGAALPIDTEPIRVAWSAIRYISDGNFSVPWEKSVPQVVLDACVQISEQDLVDGSTWKALTKSLPGFNPELEELRGPREDRVLLFEHAMNVARNAKTDRNITAEFLCAFLVSSISPGTLSHIHVAKQYLDIFPSLLIWYGLCAGLSSRSTLESGNNGLVRRVRRELLKEEHFLQSPTCDIGFSELELNSQSARELTDVRTNAFNQIIIELFPCINAYYRPQRAEGFSDATSNDVRPALDELTDQLNRTREAIGRFRRAIGVSDTHLFPADKDRKRKVGR